jgi:DNA-binding response OmpR family regulator
MTQNTQKQSVPILLVDDKSDTRLSVEAFLEFEGFNIIGVDSGEAALEAIAREKPALVLLDLNLPGMDGLDVLRKLRAEDATRELPVIIVSARGDSHDVVIGLRAGANDYLVKPVQLELLTARINNQLRLDHYKRSSATQGQKIARLTTLVEEAVPQEAAQRGEIKTLLAELHKNHSPAATEPAEAEKPDQAPKPDQAQKPEQPEKPTSPPAEAAPPAPRTDP